MFSHCGAFHCFICNNGQRTTSVTDELWIIVNCDLEAASSVCRNESRVQLRPTLWRKQKQNYTTGKQAQRWQQTCRFLHVALWGTHPLSFILVLNRLLSVWNGPLHIVYGVLHIVLYAVYHLPLGEVSSRGGEGNAQPERRKEGARCVGQEEEEWMETEVRWTEMGRGKKRDRTDNHVTRLLVFLNFLHCGRRSFVSST